MADARDHAEKDPMRDLAAFVGVLGAATSLERFVAWPDALIPVFLASGVLGAVVVGLAWWRVAGWSRLDALSAPAGTLIRVLLLAITAVAGVFVQFLPTAWYASAWSSGTQSFLADVGIALRPPLRQASECVKDMLWIAAFAAMPIWVRARLVGRKTGPTYREITAWTRALVTVLSALIVGILAMAHWKDDEYFVHVAVQAAMLFAFLALLLRYLTQSADIRERDATASVGWINPALLQMGLGKENADTPFDHVAAAGTILLEVCHRLNLRAPLRFLDACGGVGSFVSWVHDHADRFNLYVLADVREDAVRLARARLASLRKVQVEALAVAVDIRHGEAVKRVLAGLEFDVVLLNQSIQFFDPDAGETRSVLQTLRDLVSENGVVIVVDEFPQYAPRPHPGDSPEQRREIMRERANVLLPMYMVDPAFVVEQAAKAGLTLIEITTTSLQRKHYHPPITGLVFRPTGARGCPGGQVRLEWRCVTSETGSVAAGDGATRQRDETS